MKYPRTASYPMIFLRRWRMRRMSEQKLQEAHDQYQSVLHNPDKTQQALLIATLDLQHAHCALDREKSWVLISKAEKLGVEIPNHDEKSSWWRNDSEFGDPPVQYWLSEKGRRAVANLIRDERRRTWEWRIKVLTPILTVLVSVLGLVIALITLFVRFGASPTR